MLPRKKRTRNEHLNLLPGKKGPEMKIKDQLQCGMPTYITNLVSLIINNEIASNLEDHRYQKIAFMRLEFIFRF